MHRTRFILIVALGVLLLILLLPWTSAAKPLRDVVRFQAPEGCPSAARFASLVEQRLSGDVPDSETELLISVERADDAVVGSLQFRTPKVAT